MGMMSNSPRRIFNTWDDSGLPAGENHIGEVGKSLATVSATVLLDFATNYAALDLVEASAVPTVLSNCARVAGGAGVIRDAVVHDRGDQGPSIQFLVLTGTPANTTLTCNSALDFDDKDLDDVVGIITVASPHTFAVDAVGDWSDLTSGQVAWKKGTDIYFQCASDTRNLWMLTQARGPWNAGAVAELGITLKIEQF